MRSDRYQIALIALGVIATAGMGVFFYRELFPEYRLYQNDYVALEKFRSSYTGEPPPVFKEGIKQIVIERDDKGPAVIDRCISCHVALQFPHFSPTKIARDINGNILYDAAGVPVQVANDQYIWTQLDRRIAELQDTKVNEQLTSSGETAKVKHRLQEANDLLALKAVEVGKRTYDVTKVLSMHPLMGAETRPFEFHPVESYGCTSCHNGNGRGLTTEKAHGPVFDGQYEQEFVGYVPQFLEKDTRNDPAFSKVFNGKPSHDLLFQTAPIYVGALIQAKCMQCHTTTSSTLENAAFSTAALIQRHQNRTQTVQAALLNEKTTLLDSLALIRQIQADGISTAVQQLEKRSQNYTLPAQALEDAATQLAFLQKTKKGLSDELATKEVLDQLNAASLSMLGDRSLVNLLQKELENTKNAKLTLDEFLNLHASDKEADGSIFAKMAALELTEALAHHVQDVESSFKKATKDEKAIAAIASEIDLLTYNYHRGEQLFISQSCYACHRIAGFARGGVGPELTQEGLSYPWYVKQKMVWPQSDLRSSTMPNMKIDHEELEDLLTFVLGQVGPNQAISPTAYKTALQQWESGQKKAWERAITPAEILDLRLSMAVFATQGCAACHRLKGFDSDVGYAIEKKQGNNDFDALYSEKQWFQQLFPENITGSQIVRNIDAHAAEIDLRIAPDVRKGSILEEIEKDQPNTIESFYSPFKFAMRAKNAELGSSQEKLADWKEKVHRVLMIFIQEYGLGRLIGPKPNWTGIYQSDEWLMEHFRNPAGHVPRSIMPVFPFDDSKFYALTHLLDVLGIRNRDEVRTIWEHRGFSPELAFHLHCAQCHGDFKQGNGPVAEWIYPIPKNLGDANFLRNLTKANAIHSITHGVRGTPMSPWGEAANKPGVDGIPVLTEEEIGKLVDWLYSFLPGESNATGRQNIPKWKYSPEDAIKELHREGNTLKSDQRHREKAEEIKLAPELAALPTGNQYLASLKPMTAMTSTTDVDAYFDAEPNLQSDSEEQDLYYIKKKFYTPENIDQGRAFFEINCAVCHGKEGDGSGQRAEAMHDAKPRMLTNLDWIHTRDDLRLLRSIKYGVAGTSMTPWGDFTSSLQRMQLVIFIRSLSEAAELRTALGEAIYKAFDEADFQIEKARGGYYSELTALEGKLENLQDMRDRLYDKAKTGDGSPARAINAYEEELNLLAKIKGLKEQDKLYVEMKANVKREKDLYDSMGKSLIQGGGQEDLEGYIKALSLLDNTFALANNTLTYQFSAEKSQQVAALGENLQNRIQQKIDRLTQQKKGIEGKINSPERTRGLAELSAQINSLTKMRNLLTAGFEESLRIRQQQAALYAKIAERASSAKEGKN